MAPLLSTMTTGFPSLAGLLGAVLGGVGVATTMTILGIAPILSVLAATILALDVLYYKRRTSVNTDAAMQELVTSPGSARRVSSHRESRK